jgi:MFS family permease
MEEVMFMNLTLLKNKNLSLLVIGQFVSQIGSGMQSFAFSLYVLRLTGSGSLFASVLAAGMIPRLILGPICGVFADWFDRKKIIVYLDLISGLLIGILYVISVTSGLSMFHIYTTVFLLSVISSLFGPAIGTAIPSVVSKDDLMQANALNSLLMTVGNIIYPLLAGILFGIYGISVVLLINAVSFIFSAISEMFIDLRSPEKKPGSFSLNSFKNDFKAGIVFIINNKLIRRLLLLALIANAVLSPSFTVGFIYVANMVIKISEFQLGILQTVLVVGSLVGTFAAGYVAKRVSLTRLMYLALITIGLLVCLIAANSSSYYLNIFNSNLIPYITLALLGLLVACTATVVNIGLSTMQQKIIPLDIMGRVSSVQGTVCMCAIPIGQIVFGMMFDRTASYIPLLISGIILVTTGLIFNYSTNRGEKVASVDNENEVLLGIE